MSRFEGEPLRTSPVQDSRKPMKIQNWHYPLQHSQSEHESPSTPEVTCRNGKLGYRIRIWDIEDFKEENMVGIIYMTSVYGPHIRKAPVWSCSWRLLIQRVSFGKAKLIPSIERRKFYCYSKACSTGHSATWLG